MCSSDLGQGRPPLPALSNASYSSKILALYDAEYVRDRAFAGTSGSGTWLLELTGSGLLARPLGTRFQAQILPHQILTERGHILHRRNQIVVRLDRRTYSPVLRQADLPQTLTTPWLNGRTLRYEYA